MALHGQQNYYEVLEVEPTASVEEIHRAFMKARTTYSKNSPALYTVFSPDEADQLNELLEEAFAVLSDQRRRADYDKKIGLTREELRQAAQHIASSTPLHKVQAPQPSRFEDLPDFDIESGVFKPATADLPPRATAESAVASDPTLGKTRYSRYRIDEEIENEINSETVFDGTFLSRIRQYKNISIDQIVEISKFGKHHIVSVENNDFSGLPADVFVRGLVSQFARILNLDSSKVLSSYMSFLKESRGS
ncbi:MAG: hypothetical protein COT74_04740 [Bdellovibrionales bacterium CG10_big_fil_rev_8_21_14_0_10_45_34]|nr:MAG: hypothetical protein COT74_04740 [Bdellovibrionales bacterium CG10_big_fil_rev_8_21_14_0_10_45_34]